jgi:hypothetical protein
VCCGGGWWNVGAIAACWCCSALPCTHTRRTLQADPNKWERQWAGLGEALEGNELVLSDYDVKSDPAVPQLQQQQQLAAQSVAICR